MKTKRDLWVEMSIREIWTQCHFAEISYLHIDPKAVNANDAIFSSIHSFLSHCAMVSKMLAAKDDDYPEKPIGKVVGITENSIIHKRKFRNHLEHYDERMKKWIDKFSNGAGVGTYNIGPKSMFNATNMILVSHYDPTNHIFTFVDEDFNLSEVYCEVRRIKQIADQWVKKMEAGQIVPPFIQ